jgi:hypothetical protein
MPAAPDTLKRELQRGQHLYWGGWSGLTDGPAKTVSWEGARVKELQLDDRPYPWKATPTGATVLLPAGAHCFRLTTGN